MTTGILVSNYGISAFCDEDSVSEGEIIDEFDDWLWQCTSNHENVYRPEKIFFNGRSTVCVFPDGEKVVVQCAENEKFVPEYGVMACIVKKVFGGNRSEFLRVVEAGKVQIQPTKKEKKAKKVEMEAEKPIEQA
jgi:hypothetical protein